MSAASARRAKLARMMNDPNALPLAFNIDRDGHEYESDLFDVTPSPSPQAGGPVALF